MLGNEDKLQALAAILSIHRACDGEYSALIAPARVQNSSQPQAQEMSSMHIASNNQGNISVG